MGKTCLPEGGAGNFWCRPFFLVDVFTTCPEIGKGLGRPLVDCASRWRIDPALPINSVHYHRRGPMPGCCIGRPAWPKSWGRHKFKAFINHSDFCLAIGTDMSISASRKNGLWMRSSISPSYSRSESSERRKPTTRSTANSFSINAFSIHRSSRPNTKS